MKARTQLAAVAVGAVVAIASSQLLAHPEGYGPGWMGCWGTGYGMGPGMMGGYGGGWGMGPA